MQDNDQNNWKQRLENADDLQAEILKDKNAAWEKLYTRLHNKPARKLTNWYWAAACLLTIGITSSIIIFNNEKHQTSITVASPTIQTPSIKKQSLQTEQKHTELSLLSSAEKSKKLMTLKDKAAKKIESGSNNEFLIDSAKEQAVTATITEPTLNFDSSVKEITTAVPVKKKLIVIHINDLGQPMEGATADTKFEKHGFQLKILNNETYNPASANFPNNGIILIKSKNASN
jgi:hypothetical protein